LHKRLPEARSWRQRKRNHCSRTPDKQTVCKLPEFNQNHLDHVDCKYCR